MHNITYLTRRRKKKCKTFHNLSRTTFPILHFIHHFCHLHCRHSVYARLSSFRFFVQHCIKTRFLDISSHLLRFSDRQCKQGHRLRHVQWSDRAFHLHLQSAIQKLSYPHATIYELHRIDRKGKNVILMSCFTVLLSIIVQYCAHMPRHNMTIQSGLRCPFPNDRFYFCLVYFCNLLSL